jgi:hypothetical protein
MPVRNAGSLTTVGSVGSITTLASANNLLTVTNPTGPVTTLTPNESPTFTGTATAAKLVTSSRILANNTPGSLVIQPNGPTTTTGKVQVTTTGKVQLSSGGSFVTTTSVAFSTVTAASGVKFQPSSSKDTEITFGVTLGGTITMTYGPTPGTANTILSSFVTVAGVVITKRIPATWYVVITLITATISSVKIQTV